MLRNRRFRRNSVRSRKTSRVSEINTNRINKRKYYGVGVEKREFEQTLDYHVNHTAVSKSLERSGISVNESFDNAKAESVTDSVLQGASFLRSGTDEVVNDLAPKIRDSFEKGTRRAFDTTGDALPKPDDVEDRVTSLVEEQANYVTNLVSDLRQKARDILTEGLSDGKSENRIKNELDTELKHLKDNRSDTIAETETVKASREGVETTFEENNVQKVMWVAEIDERTCDTGTFRVAYNGEVYTSCRQLHEQIFDRTGNYPRPPQHPNDRCVIVAVQ